MKRLPLLLRLIRCHAGESDNVRRLRLGLLVLKLLAACACSPTDTEADCNWQARPIWNISPDSSGCAVVQGIPEAGSYIAPPGLCGVAELGGAEWRVTGPSDVVLYQRPGELQPPQYVTWPCDRGANVLKSK